jgi:hypothetical protein
MIWSECLYYVTSTVVKIWQYTHAPLSDDWYYKNEISAIFMPPFEEEGVYCFANVGLSVGLSVGRPHGLRWFTW